MRVPTLQFLHVKMQQICQPAKCESPQAGWGELFPVYLRGCAEVRCDQSHSGASSYLRNNDRPGAGPYLVSISRRLFEKA